MPNFTEKKNFDDSRTVLYTVVHDLGTADSPRRHDFYEIVLVTSGTVEMNLCGKKLNMPIGTMGLIRPGDLHSKKGEGSTCIELAFSRQYMEGLAGYLECEEQLEELLALPYIAPVLLSHFEFHRIKGKAQAIGAMAEEDGKRIRTSMKELLFEIFTKYYKKDFSSDADTYENLPIWLVEALSSWQTPEHRSKGLEYFCEQSGFSKEHICRSFKTYLGMSPTAYLNHQRLKYAIALMRNTNYSIIDIAFEAGFKSSSRFYQVFKDAYGMSPREFCSQGKAKKGDVNI